MTIYLGNIPYAMTPADIIELLADYGRAENIRIPLHHSDATPRGLAFVDMPEAGGRRAIADLDGKPYGGRRIDVREAQPPRSRRDAQMSEVRA